MRRSLLICGIVIGSLLALGPLWGMLGTAFGMMHAFQALGSGPGISDPKAMSGAIGVTLLATAGGFVACPIGILLLVICIVLLINTPKEPPPLPPGSERLTDQGS